MSPSKTESLGWLFIIGFIGYSKFTICSALLNEERPNIINDMSKNINTKNIFPSSNQHSNLYNSNVDEAMLNTSNKMPKLGNDKPSTLSYNSNNYDPLIGGNNSNNISYNSTLPAFASNFDSNHNQNQSYSHEYWSPSKNIDEQNIFIESLANILSCNNKLEVLFIHAPMTKIDKITIFVYETLDNLQSNNCNHKKQMFLFDDKLFTLLLGCVINLNRINCTPNTPFTEATYKSIYKSTSETTCALSIIISCNILRNINNNLTNYELQKIFIHETMTKYIKWQYLVMKHYINVHSINCNYGKQMFLLNDKLYKLLFVIIVSKPRQINLNINMINCIASFKNITPDCKSTYQSTKEPAYELTHARFIAQSVSSIQPPAIAIIIIYEGNIIIWNVNLKMMKFCDSMMSVFFVLYVCSALSILCKIVYVCCF